MKRYEIIGEPTFDLMEIEGSSLILYEDFESLISAKIKETEDKIKFINASDSVFKGSMSASKELHRLRGIKKELKNLL